MQRRSGASVASHHRADYLVEYALPSGYHLDDKRCSPSPRRKKKRMPAGVEIAHCSGSLPVSALPSSGPVDRHDGTNTGPQSPSQAKERVKRCRESRNHGQSGIGRVCWRQMPSSTLRWRWSRSLSSASTALLPSAPRHLICPRHPDLACVS